MPPTRELRGRLVRRASGRSGSPGHGSAHSEAGGGSHRGAARSEVHEVESPRVLDRWAAGARASRGLPQSGAARHCQTRRRLRKRDPPRESPRCVDGGGGRAPGRGGRADLRGSDDGGGERTVGSPSGLPPSSVGCSRRGPGRTACRWRIRSGSVDISPVAGSPSEVPRPAVRPDEEHGRRHPQTHPNVRQSGWSSLCAYEDRGSSTRGLGALTPGPHLLRATVGHTPPHALTHSRVGAARRGPTSGRARGVRPLAR